MVTTNFFFHLGMKTPWQPAGGIEIDHVIHSGHGAHQHQLLDDLGRGRLQTQSQLAHRDFIRDLNGDGFGFPLHGDAAQTLRFGFLLE